MDEVQIWTREQFFDGVAEDALPRGIQPLEIPVESGQAQQVERQCEEPLEILLGASSLHELADLSANLREHHEQVFVRLADFATEELHHTDHFTPRQDRQRK